MTDINCTNCGNVTNNPKFCSRSCSASFTNKTHKKRKAKPKYCIKCNKYLPNAKRHGSMCTDCNGNFVDWENTTLDEVYKKRRYQRNSRLRTRSRLKYLKSNKPKHCIYCGYNKHFDVCHIQGIDTFPIDTVVSVVNSIDNLIALCKNHHWEFDNGHLTIEEIYK